MARHRIVVPVYRSEAWIGRCIASIRAQSAADWRCIVIDDRSPDRTFERAVEAAAGDTRITVLQSPERRWALSNIVEGIRAIAHDPEDVVVTVDGDDWLEHADVLVRLDEVYDGGDVWMTYGSYRRWEGTLPDRLGLTRKRGIARPYPPDVIDERAFRRHRWVASHLRTFKRFLWDALRDEDLRDEQGRYYRVAWDLAFMFPMLEMAGPEHIAFLPDTLYVYNKANPISDEKIAEDEQRRTDARIRRKPPYPRLVRA